MVHLAIPSSPEHIVIVKIFCHSPHIIESEPASSFQLRCIAIFSFCPCTCTPASPPFKSPFTAVRSIRTEKGLHMLLLGNSMNFSLPKGLFFRSSSNLRFCLNATETRNPRSANSAPAPVAMPIMANFETPNVTDPASVSHHVTRHH